MRNKPTRELLEEYSELKMNYWENPSEQLLNEVELELNEIRRIQLKDIEEELNRRRLRGTRVMGDEHMASKNNYINREEFENYVMFADERLKKQKVKNDELERSVKIMGFVITVMIAVIISMLRGVIGG